MAIRHDITLSTTEPNNDIGLLKIRQADEQTQTLVVQLTATSQPKSYEGLQAFFCAKLGQSIGLGIIEQKLEQSEMTNPKTGQLEYTFRPEDWQQIGRQVGYFSFRKMKDDGHEYVEQFTTRDFYFNVTKNVFSEGLTEVKKDGSTYVWTIEDLIRLFNEYIASGKTDWKEFVEQNKEILESVDPGGKILLELINSRTSYSGELFPELNARLTADFTNMQDSLLRGTLDVELLRAENETDSQLINKAIAYVHQNFANGKILLTKSVYEIDDKIILKSNVHIDGRGNELIQSENAELKEIFGKDEEKLENVDISNMKIDINKSNQSSYISGEEHNTGRSFLLNNVDNLAFRNLVFKDMFGSAIYVTDSSNIKFYDVTINDTTGMFVPAINLIRIKSASVDNCNFFGVREFGVSSSNFGVQAKDSVSDISITNSYFEHFQAIIDGSKTGGTTLLGSNARITNCVFIEPLADITIRYCRGGSMIGNITRGSGDYGLSVGDAENIIVNGNYVEGSNTVGIGIRKSKYCTVSNNILKNPCSNFKPDYPLIEAQRTGIYVVGSSIGTIVNGNSILDTNTSPAKMFHGIRVEDYAASVKGEDSSAAVISNNIINGSKSEIDIYADGTNNKLFLNSRADGKDTGINLGLQPFYTPKKGDLRTNTLTDKPYFYDGTKWSSLSRIVERPTSATSAGKAGDIAMDSTYFYWCPVDNTWYRVQKTAW
ncbi:BppU family phage baseplate upper protein [Enterococcus diestrammenae]|uniref:Right handed beta helix domain-containing protein n=1 Tax=Enterococcus diestrammenae TaxID=1155073 RepID=A0ABV0EYZ9_9ENTE|nr:BppU family phage baseplate upper protein [Enterococcus diestrammenae]KAF1294809.1 hypothetical protein BAU18_03660 [Enterococcus diestrammenae]